MSQHLHRDVLLGNLQNYLARVRQVEEKRTPCSLRSSCDALILGAIDQPQDVINWDDYPARDCLRPVLISTIRRALRVTDVLAPMRGEGLLIILPLTSLPGATIVAERLRSLVQKKQFSYSNIEFRLTLSLGVVTIHPHDSFESLRDRLSRTLALASQAGEDQIKTEGDISPSVNST